MVLLMVRRFRFGWCCWWWGDFDLYGYGYYCYCYPYCYLCCSDRMMVLLMVRTIDLGWRLLLFLLLSRRWCCWWWGGFDWDGECCYHYGYCYHYCSDRMMVLLMVMRFQLGWRSLVLLYFCRYNVVLLWWWWDFSWDGESVALPLWHNRYRDGYFYRYDGELLMVRAMRVRSSLLWSWK